MDNMVVNLCFNARHYNTHQLREETGLPWKSHLKAYSSLSMFSRDMDAESFYTDQSHINQKSRTFSPCENEMDLMDCRHEKHG